MFGLKRKAQERAREAYTQALSLHRKAKERGDTRAQHAAQEALVDAMHQRLRAGC